LRSLWLAPELLLRGRSFTFVCSAGWLVSVAGSMPRHDPHRV
jgi:hypothetical protein